MTPLALTRLARLIGREIAAGFHDHDAEMRAQDDAAAAAADPLARAAGDLLALTQPLAEALARLPRTAGSPQAEWLAKAQTYLVAQREAESAGEPHGPRD